jgi:methionine synthase II (cobalamin-independent)
LSGLKLLDGTELYLGVVHAKDGVEGTKARIAAAHRYVPEFGIATECGMARARSEETVRTLLKIHAQVCAGN